MTTPAWYIETCVKAPLPVMSPMAHTPSVTRQRSSTGAVRESLATPTVSSPTAAGSARRPVATSSFSAVTVAPPARVTVNADPSWVTFSAPTP